MITFKKLQLVKGIIHNRLFIRLPIFQRIFQRISQEPEFSQVWDLWKNTENIIKFLYRPNSEKITHSIFQQISKTLVLARFPHFWDKKIFPGKFGSAMPNFIWVSSTMPKFSKS